MVRNSIEIGYFCWIARNAFKLSYIRYLLLKYSLWFDRYFSKNVEHYIIEDNSFKKLGIVTLTIAGSKKSVSLSNFALAEEYKGKHLSMPILSCVLFNLNMYRYGSVNLKVRKSNNPAYNLYKSLGFVAEES
jgi:hypothetical protein